MGEVTVNPVVEQQATSLAQDNRVADPSISKIYWFPHDREVRLVEVTDQVPVSGETRIHPFYFRASPMDGLPMPSAIALIRPQEDGQLSLPTGWGGWKDAREISPAK